MIPETIPADVESAIVTPHEHEGAQNPPIWLVFRDSGDGDGWWIYCACSSEDSARYHWQSAHTTPKSRVVVERVPLDHAFGSSVRHAFWNEELARRKAFLASRDREDYQSLMRAFRNAGKGS